MSFIEKATSAVVGCAELLESEANGIGVFRSMDATEAANWLRDVASQLREACADGDDSVEDIPLQAVPGNSLCSDIISSLTLARFKAAGLDNAMAVQAQNVARDIVEEVQELHVKKDKAK